MDFSTFRRTRRGFSLVELMVAIMILGLGLVMVATVFPVGLDMTRETVHESMALAAAQAAAEVVRVKVPTEHTSIIPVLSMISPPPPLPPPPPPPPEPITSLFTVQQPLVRPDDAKVEAWKAYTGDGVLKNYGLENDTVIVATESWSQVPNPLYTWPATPPPPNPVYPRIWFSKSTSWLMSAASPKLTRGFTELSFWDADPLTPFSGPVSPTRPHTCYVLASQNLPVDWKARADNRNPVRPVLSTERIDSGATVAAPRASAHLPLIRIDPSSYFVGDERRPVAVHLADRVYPPVSGIDPATFQKLIPEPAATVPDRWDAEKAIATLAAECRYSWTVFQHRAPNNGGKHSFVLTIAVTYRSDPAARYARQEEYQSTYMTSLPVWQRWATNDICLDYLWNDPPPAPGTEGDLTMQWLRTPKLKAQNDVQNPPSDADYCDFLFPRPWLVMLESVAADGTVRCTAEVARLLPADSFFIVAGTRRINGSTGVAEGMGFYAGTPHKVLSCKWDARQLGKVYTSQDLATLQIAKPENGNDLFYVPVWVFPPAVVTHPTSPTGTINPADSSSIIAVAGIFDTRSPVVGVYQREVTLP